MAFLILFAGSMAYALWRGGAPERAAAFVLLAGVVSTSTAQAFDAHRFATVQWGVAMVDVAVLIGFLSVALLSTRYWPMWLTALQIIQLCSDFAKLLPGVAELTYAMASSLIGYPVALILAVATVRHRMRSARYGAQPSWRHQLPD
jgi:Flp pilus assembly pilin Flp